MHCSTLQGTKLITKSIVGKPERPFPAHGEVGEVKVCARQTAWDIHALAVSDNRRHEVAYGVCSDFSPCKCHGVKDWSSSGTCSDDHSQALFLLSRLVPGLQCVRTNQAVVVSCVLAGKFRYLSGNGQAMWSSCVGMSDDMVFALMQACCWERPLRVGANHVDMQQSLLSDSI